MPEDINMCGLKLRQLRTGGSESIRVERAFCHWAIVQICSQEAASVRKQVEAFLRKQVEAVLSDASCAVRSLESRFG